MRPTSGTWLTVVQGEACNHLWHRMSCQKLCAHSFGSIGSWCITSKISSCGRRFIFGTRLVGFATIGSSHRFQQLSMKSQMKRRAKFVCNSHHNRHRHPPAEALQLYEYRAQLPGRQNAAAVRQKDLSGPLKSPGWWCFLETFLSANIWPASFQ